MNPVTPSRVKATIPSTTGSTCERLEKLYEFPQLLYEDVLYKYNEDGSITDEYKADICALGCVGDGNGGGGTPNPNMPAPTGVNATDGSFNDKIKVTWNAVVAPTGIAAVTSYKIYRSLSTNTNPANATLIATVAAPTVEYDDPVDGDLAVGTTYNYWVTATNGSDTSAYSNYDVGSADAPTTTLDAIADLAATQGFSSGPGGIISLVWTAPSGATKFDVYRHTANDFSAATKIASDYVPEDATTKLIATTSPDSIWNNGGGKIVYFHTPPLPTVQYYFWVVAKKDSPPALSEESNEALGWVVTQYLPYGTGVMQIGRGVTKEEGVDFVGTTIRVVLFGGGGGGAGGSEAYGGGGGGGPAVVVEEFTIGLGDILSLVCTPDADITSNAAATADGDNGAQVEFQINGVTVMTAKAGSGGDFSASGGGGGGAGSTGSTGDVAPTIYEGTAGNPGVGPAGGASGYRFGSRRLPAAHYFGFGVGSWNGDASGAGAAGGGSKASPGAGVLATGGRGATGYAVVAYGP